MSKKLARNGGIWSAWLMAATLAFSQESDKPDLYYAPNKEAKPFDASGVDIEEGILKRLAQNACILARNAEMKFETRSKLLAIAYYLNPEERILKDSIESLSMGIQPNPVRLNGDDVPTISEIAEETVAITFHIYGKATDPDTVALVSMLFDTTFELYPDYENLAYSRTIFRKNYDVVEWNDVLVATRDMPPAPIDSAQAKAIIAEQIKNELQGLMPKEPEVELNGNLQLKKRQSGVHGLLIIPLPNGEMAGKATRMSASYLKSVGSSGSVRGLKFNQKVGPMMLGGLPNVATLMEVRHGDWLGEGVIEFAFQEKLVPKDGDSAGLATGLMVESLVTGVELDNKTFACTGALNSDGSVQPIGGVVAKLRGARNTGAKIVAIPHANRYALSDLTILGQASVLSELQVFLVEEFDEALLLVQKEQSEELRASLADFELLQKGFESVGVMQTVRSQKGQQLLNRILERTPNHASARLMMNVSAGKMPETISLNGSMEEINKLMMALMLTVNPGSMAANGDLEFYQGKLEEFEKTREKMDPRMEAMADAAQNFCQGCVVYKEGKRTIAESRMKAALEQALEAMIEIRRDPELIEEMGF